MIARKAPTIAFIFFLFMLLVLYLSFLFTRNKIDIWMAEEESHSLLKNLLPQIIHFYENGQNRKALEVLQSIDEQAVGKESKYKIHLLKAVIYKKQNYLLSALKEIRLAQIHQQTAFSKTLEGMILENLGENDLALINYQEVIQKNKGYYPAYEKLADRYYLENNLEASVRYLQKAEIHSFKLNHTTANNVILFKKIFMEYLKDQGRLSQTSLNQMKNFQETRYLSFVFIIQGLIHWEKNRSSAFSWNRNEELNYFRKAVQVSTKGDKIYYQLFLGLLNFYLEKSSIAKNQFEQILHAFPQEDLFSAILYEALGDNALRERHYALSHQYYSSIRNKTIQSEPNLAYRLKLAQLYQSKNFITLKLDEKNPLTSSKLNAETTTYRKDSPPLKYPTKKINSSDSINLNFSYLIEKILELEQEKSWKKMFFLLNPYLKKHPDAPLFLIQKAANTAVHLKKYSAAEKFYQRIINQGGNPKMVAQAYNNWSMIWLIKNNKEKAVSTIFSGLEFYPLPSLYYNMSLIQKSDGNLLDYFYSLKKANSVLSKENNPSLSARVYLEMSFILTYARVYQRANSYLSKAKMLDPDYVKKHHHERKNFFRNQ